MDDALRVSCTQPVELNGEITPSGDKSITIRALILGALAKGDTAIKNPLNALDTRSALLAVQLLGAGIYEREREWIVIGNELHSPPGALDLGNSGTALRLLTGALAGYEGVEAVLTGDVSLRSRPLARIVDPLREMGADIEYLEDEGRAPVRVRGKRLNGFRYELPVPSAQVKSALLLAGLGADNTVEIIERTASRDHTERMLPEFGVPLEIDEGDGRRVLKLEGGAKPKCAEVIVPGDISAAFVWIVLGLLLSGEGLSIKNVGLNPTRLGALRVLDAAGARIVVEQVGSHGFEPFGVITVHSSRLKGFHVDSGEIPSLIDEIPLLTLAATQAEGESVIEGAAELKVKESDRLLTTAETLAAFGAKVDLTADGIRISGPQRLHSAAVECAGDHRIAMLALGCAVLAEGESEIAGFGSVAVSYPGLLTDVGKLLTGVEFVQTA
jgi:3-phosphoshikimate 1-carboxyvinyltransferase